MDALHKFWYLFWDPTPYGAHATTKCNFGKIQIAKGVYKDNKPEEGQIYMTLNKIFKLESTSNCLIKIGLMLHCLVWLK